MTSEKAKKITPWISIGLGLLLLISAYLISGRHNRQIREIIETDGVYTIGTITHISNKYATITFEFEHEGRTIIGNVHNDQYFEYAVIDRQYVVRYVPEKITERDITDYAIIYINVPIPQDYIIDQIIKSLAKQDSTIVKQL